MKPSYQLWHASHNVKGKILCSPRTGPGGREVCVACGAKRWSRPESFGPHCGGSIDRDSRTSKPCPKNQHEPQSSESNG